MSLFFRLVGITIVLGSITEFFRRRHLKRNGVDPKDFYAGKKEWPA